MKKLFLLLSLFGVVGLHAAAAQEMIWVKPAGKNVEPVQVPKGFFPTLDNFVEDLGKQKSKDDAIPLPNIDAAHLEHAVNFVRGKDHDQYMYLLPVTHEQLKDNDITLEGFLNILNFLGAKNLLTKFYVAWLNHPQNERAAVHEGALGQTIFNQMGLDTNKINEDYLLSEKVSADKQFYADNVIDYGVHQSDSGVSIQDLIDKKLDRHIVYYADDADDVWPLGDETKSIVIPSQGELLREPDERFIVGDPLGPWRNDDEYWRAVDNLYAPLAALRGERTPYITSLKGLRNIPDKNEVWKFEITGQGIGSLRSGIFKGFNNLREIIISNCKNLQRIFPGVFGGISKLQSLNVNGCGLARISADMFQGIPSSTFLALGNNHIITIEENAFKNTPKVGWLDLRGNKITHLTAETFAGLDNLVTLFLQDNPLELIDRDVFRKLSKLEKIYLTRDPKIEKLIKKVILPKNCIITWKEEGGGNRAPNTIVKVFMPDGKTFLFDRFRKIVMEGVLFPRKGIVKIHKVHGHITYDQYCAYAYQYPDLVQGDFYEQFTMMPYDQDLRYDSSSGLVWRVLDSNDDSKRRYDEAGPHLITLQEMEAYQEYITNP